MMISYKIYWIGIGFGADREKRFTVTESESINRSQVLITTDPFKTKFFGFFKEDTWRSPIGPAHNMCSDPLQVGRTPVCSHSRWIVPSPALSRSAAKLRASTPVAARPMRDGRLLTSLLFFYSLAPSCASALFALYRWLYNKTVEA